MSSQQKGAKKIGLNTVISWGASVVIIGLMFKILHWQGGEYMIAIGLLTESFLFFILGIASMTVVEDVPDGQKAADINDLLSTAITPKVIERLSMGFQQFNKTVESVNQVAGSFNVTQNLIKELETATTDVKKFRDNMSVVATGFGEFNKSLTAVGQMAAATQGMMKDFDSAAQGMKSFSKSMTDMNAGFAQFTQTLAAINQMTTQSQSMLKEFEAAAVGMRNYNKNITDLSKVYAAQLEAFKK